MEDALPCGSRESGVAGTYAAEKTAATEEASISWKLRREHSASIFKRTHLLIQRTGPGVKPKEEFFDTDRTYFTRPPIPFQPFAQKVKLPADAKVIFHGDFMATFVRL